MAALTPARDRAIRLLVADMRAARSPEHYRITGRGMARMMWPDSPAWEKRTRRRGSNHPGQMGGTMPMLGARLLWALGDAGLLWHDTSGTTYSWRVTPAAEHYVDAA